MPRNSAGTYSLPEAPFTPNTPISSSATNSNNSDIADALTDSLSRNGQGGMSALLGLSLSGFNYTSDPDTGMSRSAANTQVITCGDQDWTFSTTDITAPDGSSLLPLIGEIRMWALPTAPTGWILMRGQACTTTYPLWRAALISAGNPYGTSGGDPLFPDLQCVVPAGLDATSRGILDGAATLGALLGAQTRAVNQDNLPAVSFDNSGIALTDDRAFRTASPVLPGNAPLLTAPVAGGVTSASTSKVAIEVASGSISITAQGSAASGGSGVPLIVVQPTLIINFIGRAA